MNLFNLPLENLENKYVDSFGRGWGKSNIVLVSLKKEKCNCRDHKRDVKMQEVNPSPATELKRVRKIESRL